MIGKSVNFQEERNPFNPNDIFWEETLEKKVIKQILRSEAPIFSRAVYSNIWGHRRAKKENISGSSHSSSGTGNEDLGVCGNVFLMHWTVRMFDPNGESNIRHMEVSAYVVSQTNRLPAVGGWHVCYKLFSTYVFQVLKEQSIQLGFHL